MKRSNAPRHSSEMRSTRDLILDAAERCFAAHGFAAVTMREIASDSGLKNQASLYHHFRNKRALYEAVLTRGLEPIIGLIESGHPGPTASTPTAMRRQVVEATLDHLFDYLADHPHLPGLIQRAGLDDSRYLRRTMPQLFFPLYEAGLGALAGAGGLWRETDLPHVAFGIYNLIFGYFANAPLFEVLMPARPHSEEAVDRQRRFVKTAVAQLLGVAPGNGKGGRDS